MFRENLGFFQAEKFATQRSSVFNVSKFGWLVHISLRGFARIPRSAAPRISTGDRHGIPVEVNYAILLKALRGGRDTTADGQSRYIKVASITRAVRMETQQISPEVHRENLQKKKILRFLTQYLPEMCSKLLQKFVPEYFTIVYIGIPLDISLKIPCEQFQDSPDKNSGKIWEEISQKPLGPTPGKSPNVIPQTSSIRIQ